MSLLKAIRLNNFFGKGLREVLPDFNDRMLPIELNSSVNEKREIPEGDERDVEV